MLIYCAKGHKENSTQGSRLSMLKYLKRNSSPITDYYKNDPLLLKVCKTDFKCMKTLLQFEEVPLN